MDNARTSGGSWGAYADLVLAHSPVQVAALRSSRTRLRVLAYHGVHDGRSFAAQMDWLRDHATFVSLEQVRAAVVEGQGLPEHPVLVTFDDGDRSVLDTATPILRDREIPCVAFVIAGLIDTDLPCWWVEAERLHRLQRLSDSDVPMLVRDLKRVPDAERQRALQQVRDLHPPVRTPQLKSEELRRLERAGMAIGNHTLTHPCLDMCEDEVLRAEIRRAHEKLSEVLGHEPMAFAYPNGNWDARVRDVVREAGYPMAFVFDHRLVSRRADPLLISRLRVDAGTSLDRFRIIVSGLHPYLHMLRGRS